MRAALSISARRPASWAITCSRFIQRRRAQSMASLASWPSGEHVRQLVGRGAGEIGRHALLLRPDSYLCDHTLAQALRVIAPFPTRVSVHTDGGAADAK